MAWVHNLKQWQRLDEESPDYFKSIYGDPIANANRPQPKQRFVTEREFFENDVRYGECFNDTVDAGVQCQMMANVFDPKLLPYDKQIAWHFREFCYKTSAHGIPMIGRAPNQCYRIVWIILFLACMSMLFFNAQKVLDKYNKNTKIVDIQLQFDTAPFPAITVCNLNPYKASMASNVDLVRRTLAAFDGAMGKAGIKKDTTEDEKMTPPIKNDTTENHSRTIRSIARRFYTEIDHKKHSGHDGLLNKASVFEPGYSKCTCEKHSDTTAECDADPNKLAAPLTEFDRCICAFDRGTLDAWPCHLASAWKQEECGSCNDHAYCTNEPSGTIGIGNQSPCLCAPSGTFCVAYDGISSILEIWRFLGGETPTEDPAFVEAMGFEGMTDEVAIVTKAKENIMFAMATLGMEERQLLSTTKRELVHKCSFNGLACDIERDFIDHIDPIFGSCFTFNHNRSLTLTSIRAGPMYGLRILVYVNASDYMPTTEATGVRLTIHDKEDFPFPDTFGYSAPTGYISSFGLRMRRMSRLPAPYGDCLPNGKTSEYIYENYEYSVEGCYRSCFQHLVLKDCNCGDPRFPVPKGMSHCEATDPIARKCLDERMSELGDVHSNFRCRCQQPCRQSIYSVTYSAAQWPSQSLKIQLGECDGTPAECNKHYKENGAMVEVFYEQLNFEELKESEAYGFVNLLADFGGQLGLWCGISFLTCCEFIFLFLETAWMAVVHKYRKYKDKEEEGKSMETNRVAKF